MNIELGDFEGLLIAISTGGSQLLPVTSLAAVDDGLEELSITWTDPASVPNSLLLIVTRDSVQVVNTNLGAGASQPYIVSGIGSYGVTMTNKGDGVTTFDSNPATVSGVTVAETTITAVSDLAGLGPSYVGDTNTGLEDAPIAVWADSAGSNNTQNAVTAGTAGTLKLAYANGHNGVALSGTGNYFSGSSVSGASGHTLSAVFEVSSDTDYTVSQHFGAPGDARWRSSSDGFGYFGAFHSGSRLLEYPQNMPSNGTHVGIVVSDSVGYEVCIDGVWQGRRPVATVGDDFLVIGNGTLSGVVMEVDHWDQTHPRVQERALARFLCSQYGITYSEVGSNLESSIWAYDGTKNMVGTLSWEESSIQEMCPIQLSDDTLRTVYTGGWTTSSTGWATSSDNGATWTKNSTQILGNGHGGESGDCFRPNLVRISDTEFHLFYVTPLSGGGDWKKVITTDGGATWGSPILLLAKSAVPATRDDRGWANSGVIVTGGVWYGLLEASVDQSYHWQQFAVQSSDGLTWTIGDVMTSLQRGVGMWGGPNLALLGETAHVYYHASTTGEFTTQIYHAFNANFSGWLHSNDWLKIVNPIFYLSEDPFGGELANLDQIADPSIVFLRDGTMGIWFEDVDNNAQTARVLRATLPFQVTS